MTTLPFPSRVDAGRRLAQQLSEYSARSNAVVVGLPRGGMPVAFEVAQRLHLPLDVFLVRRVFAPGQPDVVVGAVAEDGVRVVNEVVVQSLGWSSDGIDEAFAVEQRELEHRARQYRQDFADRQLRDRTVILVDDALVTGSSIRVALSALEKEQPKEVIVAVPVGTREVCDEVTATAKLVCLHAVDQLASASAAYTEYPAVDDAEIRRLLLIAATR